MNFFSPVPATGTQTAITNQFAPTKPAFGLGSTLNTGAVGTNVQQQQQPQQQAAQTGPSLPPLSQSQAQLSNSLWQTTRDSPHQKPVVEQIRLLAEKWDPANPNCAFKHYFYNKVDEATIPFYKPQAFENPREWEEALERKPAPGFMPVLCPGFAPLGDRIKTQTRAVSEFNARLHQVNSSLDALLARHELQTEVRATAAQRRHTALGARILALAGRVQVLRNRGYALGSDEDELQGKLVALEREVHDPAVGAREEELWSRLITLKSVGEQLSKETDRPSKGDAGEIDDEFESKVKKVLEEHDVQIQHLRREMDNMLKVYAEWEKEQPDNKKP